LIWRISEGFKGKVNKLTTQNEALKSQLIQATNRGDYKRKQTQLEAQNTSLISQLDSSNKRLSL